MKSEWWQLRFSQICTHTRLALSLSLSLSLSRSLTAATFAQVLVSCCRRKLEDVHSSHMLALLRHILWSASLHSSWLPYRRPASSSSPCLKTYEAPPPPHGLESVNMLRECQGVERGGGHSQASSGILCWRLPAHFGLKHSKTLQLKYSICTVSREAICPDIITEHLILVDIFLGQCVIYIYIHMAKPIYNSYERLV